jgi:PAS domain S-box-containing protein
MPAGRNPTIKSKLTRALSVTTVLALGVVGASMIAQQWWQYRRSALDEAQSMAGLLAGNCAAAVSFQDAFTAREILTAVGAVEEILSARLVLKDGRVFAEWVRPGADTRRATREEFFASQIFEGAMLITRAPVVARGEVVAVLCLQTDLHPQLRRLRWAILFVVGCMVAAALVAWWMAGRVQRSLLKPVLALARAADDVARNRNYSVRAEKLSDDEIGTVTEAFNAMLEQIQQRDRELTGANEQLELQGQQVRASEERFRQLAENIREVFWLTDVSKNAMIYISPGYEAVWGRTCHSLMREPLQWLDAIHPQDRERVQRAIPQQAEGTYDIEYRIRRPSGTVRWIRDRAFPIRDAHGQVYRIAGIAEDITAAKQAEVEQRLQAEIMRSMAEGVVLVRIADSRIVYANPAFERIFGYGAGELNGQPVAVVNATSDQDPQARAAAIMAEINRRGSFTYEVHNRRKDGTEFWCRATATEFEHHELGRVVLAVQADITERHEAQEKIRQAEEKYRLLVERVPAVTYTAEIGANNPWLYISPQIEQLTGFTPAEWLANPGLWLERIHPADRAAANQADEMCQHTGRFDLEYRLRTRDERIIWVQDEGVLINLNPPTMQGVMHDVTARKEAEAELRASEARYRTLVESARDVIFTVALDGRFRSLNPVFEEITGWPAAEWVGKSFADGIHADDLPRALAQLQRVRDGVAIPFFEVRVRTRSGPYRTMELSAAPLVEDGQVTAALGIARDVTERRAAEATIREMRQRLQNIYDSSRDAIVYINPDGQLLEFNRAYETLTGYSRDELQQMNFRDLTPAEYLPMEERIIEKIITTGESQSFEKEYRRKDGQRVPIALTAFLVTDAAGQMTGLAAIVRDITLPRALQRQILEISDYEQRRIGQDLHDGLCQELRGVAFAIKGLEQRLQAAGSPEAADTAKIRQLVDQINAEARNTARGLHPVELEAGGLLAALGELTDKIQTTTGAHCFVRCDTEVPLGDTARAVHVYRIVQEAVSNALRHGQARQIGIIFEQQNGAVNLAVTDDGAGLPEDFEARRGMGMNIMTYRARMLGGSLNVQRGAGGGTVVNLSFPAP